MRKSIMCLVAAITFLAAGGCDKDETGVTSDFASACAHLTSFCPTGYSWSAYVTDQPTCMDAFVCVHDFYTGDCRATMEDGIDCLAGVGASSECGACDTIMQGLSATCAFPASCLTP